jgi:uncharacterized protein YukE
MMDPFSISLGTISLATLCAETASKIYAFFSNAKRVDATLSSLAEQINALAKVSTAVSDTWAQARGYNQSNSSLESHWSNIHEAMENCKQTLINFQNLLDELTVKEGRLFRKVRTQAGIALNEPEIAGYKNSIEAFCRVLQISLQLLEM